MPLFSFSSNATILTGNWRFTVFIVKPTQGFVSWYFSTRPADVVSFGGWAMGRDNKHVRD